MAENRLNGKPLKEQWIWLDEKLFPNDVCCAKRAGEDISAYTVVSIKKRYAFGKSIASLKLRFSGDTFFRLFCNGDFVANGPACVGGDFLPTPVPYDKYYFTECELFDTDSRALKDGIVDFYAVVRMAPVRICEFSKGRGGFFLSAEINFADGMRSYISTDETWLIRKESAFVAPLEYSEKCGGDEIYTNAAKICNIWHTERAPIPPCCETLIKPENGKEICVNANGKVEKRLSFDKIYAGYIGIKSDGAVSVKLKYYETDVCVAEETVRLCGGGNYRSMDFISVGEIVAEISDESGLSAKVEIALYASCYPVTEQARTRTSDAELNDVLDVCAHSLKYCRQSIHLDSPLHSEPLACTGDYYIESLMTVFTFGDMRLAAFDVLRTAQTLRFQDGRMFHTSYSLIWVLMLWDVFRFTGDKSLLTDCIDALTVLLDRFGGYIGENGLIENPPDYMFVDWLYPDGINLHHPPKALGQTCLNAFYFGALKTAAKIYRKTGLKRMAQDCLSRAYDLKRAMKELLWDKDRGLFCEGLNTPTAENLICETMPQNVEKKYYGKHANILAAYFGICDGKTCREILKKVMTDDSLGKVQPYFMHFLAEAVYRNGLREEYTLKIMDMWKPFVKECKKGLPEGFYPPDETYKFDHSHAWAGTPAYSLPLALTGMKIEREGFGKISFSPSLLGLEYAYVEILTPKGMIKIQLKRGAKPYIDAPESVQIRVKDTAI